MVVSASCCWHFLRYGGMANIHQMYALKNGLSFALSATSVAILALAGFVEWPLALLMMTAATAAVPLIHTFSTRLIL